MVKQWISRLSPKCSGTKATLKTLWTPSPHLQSHQVEAVADEGPHWLDSNDCGCGVLPPFWKIPCHSVFSQPAKIELTSGSCHFFQQQQMGWLHRLISKWDPTDILPCISTAFLLKVGFTCARSPVRVWILFSGWNASRLCRRCVEEFQWCPVVVSNEPVDICPYWCLRRTAIRNY